MTDRSQEMNQTLKAYGKGLGFDLRGDSVIIVGPGSPFSEHPTAYSPADLERAISTWLLQGCRLTGSVKLKIWVMRQE